MKKFLHYFSFFVIFGVVGELHASDTEWWFAEQIPTMKEPYRDVYECPSADCQLVGIQGVEQIRITDGQRYKIHNLNMYNVLMCSNGYCRDTSNNEVGVMEHDGAVMGTLPVGYYFVSHAPGENYYYRLGTGPYGDQFRPFYIYSQTEPMAEVENLADGATNYGPGDPWCDNRAGFCAFELRGELIEVEPIELLDYFDLAPVVGEVGDDYFCDGVFCEEDDGTFIGLNPYYHEFQ